MIKVYEQIKPLRERYLKAALDKPSLIQIVDASEVSEQVYDSNAIENSTLTLEETEKILLQIDLDRFISQRELFEAKNLARVVEYIAKKANEQVLTKEIILLLHQMLLSNIRDDVAGRFRRENEWVKVGNYIALNPAFVDQAIDEMLIEYNVHYDWHIIKRIAKLHLTFEHIHPFVDGNGRIGRVLNNYCLIREGFVPINIKYIDRGLYYNAFSEYDQKSSTHIMEKIVGKALTNSYHKRLAYLEGKKIVLLNEYAKISKQSHSNIINKAQRQTIEAFIEKGIWKIGI